MQICAIDQLQIILTVLWENGHPKVQMLGAIISAVISPDGANKQTVLNTCPVIYLDLK